MMPESINDVPCKRCKAPEGEGCTTPSGNPANFPHAARAAAYWAAVAKAQKENS